GEPLLAKGGLAARLRRMGRDERRLRQLPLPRAADVDEVVAIGTIPVQEHHELAGGARPRLEPRTVEVSHCRLAYWPLAYCYLVPAPRPGRPRAVWRRDKSSIAGTPPRPATDATLPRADPYPSQSGVLGA